MRREIACEVPDEQRVLEAARLKSDHRMSYADAFAAATAIAHDAELWTGDPELLLDDAPWRWLDLR
jgi:predicted nucleic acid-binding protein